MYKRHFSPSRQSLVALSLRLGLAFTFIYAAILGFLHPFEWINYFPSFLRNFIPDAALLNLYGLVELAVAGWLIWGKNIFIPSALSTALLFLGIIFNLNQFSDFYQNIGLLGIAFSLSILSYPRVIRETDIQ